MVELNLQHQRELSSDTFFGGEERSIFLRGGCPGFPKLGCALEECIV